MPIVNRRYSREQFKGRVADNATHRIKLGWKTKTAEGKEYPTPLNGFVIVHNTMGDKGFEIDYATMAALGYSREKVDKGVSLGRKAKMEDNLLPSQLEFILLSDAKQVEGGWEFPSLIDEEYKAWHPKLEDWPGGAYQGLYCHGNGDTAMRKQTDGTQRKIVCNPYGKAGVDAKDFCKLSQPGAQSQCKLTCTISLVLCKRVERGGKEELVPLVNQHNARFRLDTGSEYNSMRFLEELGNAADRLDGRIANLHGVIRFSLQKKSKPAGASGAKSDNVPQVSIALNEWQIQAREQSKRIGHGRQLTTDARPTVGGSRQIASEPDEVLADAEFTDAELEAMNSDASFGENQEEVTVQAEVAEEETAKQEAPQTDQQDKQVSHATQDIAPTQAATPAELKAMVDEITKHCMDIAKGDKAHAIEWFTDLTRWPDSADCKSSKALLETGDEPRIRFARDAARKMAEKPSQ